MALPSETLGRVHAAEVAGAGAGNVGTRAAGADQKALALVAVVARVAAVDARGALGAIASEAGLAIPLAFAAGADAAVVGAQSGNASVIGQAAPIAGRVATRRAGDPQRAGSEVAEVVAAAVVVVDAGLGRQRRAQVTRGAVVAGATGGGQTAAVGGGGGNAEPTANPVGCIRCAHQAAAAHGGVALLALTGAALGQ